MTLTTGDTVGRYNLVEPIGRGGMAEVFKAYDSRLERYVTVKVSNPAFLGTRDDRFGVEFAWMMKNIAKFDHENIVRVMDYGEQGNTFFRVMEFLEGETLRERLHKGKPPTHEVIRVVEAVGQALTQAHQHDVLHLNIKPSNVFLATDSKVYLDDLGWMQLLKKVSPEGNVGTPNYMSPEQCKGEKLDNRSDIYSFGIMIYEMVLGQVPFSADTPAAVLIRHINDPIPLPRSLDPEIPAGVERFFFKALAKNTEDRFQDALSMVEAFKKANSEEGVQTEIPLAVLEKELEVDKGISLEEEKTYDDVLIFLSYSRKDAKMMRRLHGDMEARGYNMWIDEGDLEPGTPVWEKAIANAIENAGCLVVLLSPDSKESTWVARELSYAEEMGVRIFPMLIKGDRRSSVPFRLTSTQTIDAKKDYKKALSQLIDAIDKHLNR
jgi:serine/threonine protein kinase